MKPAALLLATLAFAAGAQTEPVRTLAEAERSLADGSVATLPLPDWDSLPAGESAPLKRSYRWQARYDEAPVGYGLYFSGLLAHARISVNGHVLADTLAQSMQALPRGADRIVLLQVPDDFWTRGTNSIELLAAGPGRVSVSALQIGPAVQLATHHRNRVLGVIIGPALVAAVMATLGACMLLLSTRRRETLYAYFGAGTLAWALNNAWSVLPMQLLPGDHNVVWWTSLLSFFVAMIVIFCLRFADWRLPQVERVSWGAGLLGPVVLYAARGFDQLGFVEEYWRLGLIVLVGIAVVAVVRAALRKPDVDSLMVAGAGACSLVFAVHDWVVNHRSSDNNPVHLIPYAGLLFVVFVVRMLIDRFVRTTHELAQLNAQLEERVDARGLELHHAIEQMRFARNAAEAANRAKTSFLAAASHDLRQPAHALGLYMAALRTEPLSAGAAELTRRMSQTLAAMDQMFNALLDISRIDAGTVVPRFCHFDLAPLLRRLGDEFAVDCEARGLRLSLRLPARGLATETISDAALLESVLRNLLANAVKYNADGGVLLALRQRGPNWSLEVWDSGCGIAAADHERVFEEFVQLGNPGRQRAQGLGLGLAIARRLTVLLGHPLRLDSRLGHGSRFALMLPRVSGAPPAGPATRTGAPNQRLPGSLAALKVALIEDDGEVLEAMCLLLARWGCACVAGADAAQILKRNGDSVPAQALIADYRLSGARTGLQEAITLRRHWGTLPVLVVTGETSADMLQEVRSAGHACLHKPVAPEALRGWLEAIGR